MICASEQSVIVEKKIYSKVKKEFKARGCYFLNEEETEKVRKTIIIIALLSEVTLDFATYTTSPSCKSPDTIST